MEPELQVNLQNPVKTTHLITPHNNNKMQNPHPLFLSSFSPNKIEPQRFLLSPRRGSLSPCSSSILFEKKTKRKPLRPRYPLELLLEWILQNKAGHLMVFTQYSILNRDNPDVHVEENSSSFGTRKVFIIVTLKHLKTY